MRARTVLAILGLACSLAALVVGCPRPARAAVRVPLYWTAPDSVRSIEVVARRPDGVELALTPYADSTGTAAPAIAAAGLVQRAWVLVSEDWRSGGWLIRIRSCNGAGCAEWSNRVLIAAGVPDTVFALERPEVAAGVRMPRDSTLWKHAAGRVSWSLAFGDTAAARIVHQEELQLRERARLCELYGYWALRGVRVGCP